jgi:hypothetical protein
MIKPFYITANSLQDTIIAMEAMVKHRVKVVSVTDSGCTEGGRFHVFGLAEEEWQIEAVKNELDTGRILGK